MLDLNSSKKQLRQMARAVRDTIGRVDATQMSEHACKLLSESEELASADVILIYYPIKNEPSPLSLIDEAKRRGIKIAFPLRDKQNKMLIFKEAEIDTLSHSDFGLLEPREDAKEVSLTEKTVCIVPALLFSRTGYRLGYGGGYYDRFLSDFQGTSIGLSYSTLLVEAIEKEEHDVPLDMIITESEVLRIAPKNKRQAP